VTDDVRTNILTAALNGNIDLPTRFGSYNYYLEIVYTDANGNRGVVRSTAQIVNILTDNTISATGNIRPGNTLTTTSADFNYTIIEEFDTVTNIVLKTYSLATGDLVNTTTNGNILSANVLVNGLSQNEPYLTELTALVNGQDTVLDSVSFQTAPTNIQRGLVFSNLSINTLSATNATVNARLIGDNRDLNEITNANLLLNDGTVITFSDNQLAQLKASNVVTITIPDLTPATAYRAELVITGAIIDQRSDFIENFTTLPLNGNALTPQYTSSFFFQPTVGLETITMT